MEDPGIHGPEENMLNSPFLHVVPIYLAAQR